MASTRLSNVIVPSIWNPYVVQRTMELSNLWTSGIVQNVPELNGFNNAGGNIINMPFWQDLSGESEVLSATGTALSVNPITSAQDGAVVQFRGKAWGENNVAAVLSGGDPMQAIGDLVAGWWARDLQRILMSMLVGIFDSSTMASNILDISGVANGQGITGYGMLDAFQLLGDASDGVTAIMMHSATRTQLLKDDLIEFIPQSEGQAALPTFMGKRIVVDDSLTKTGSGSTTVYNTYLFGEGAIGYATGNNPKIVETEVDRDSLAGEDYLINRRHFVLHPRGVRYIGTATGGGPDNTVLADGDSWSKVWESKNVKIVLFKHRLTSAAS
jgi:hypothetical protein